MTLSGLVTAAPWPLQVLVDGRDLNRLLGNVFPNLDEPDRGLVSRVSRFALSTSRMTRFKLAKRDISVSDGSRRVMASIEAMTGTAMGRKLLRSMDRMARWDEQLMDVPTGEGQALVNMRGLGLYKLKGIDEPVSLVQAWLPALDELSSSLPNPKNCVLLDLDAVDKSPVADDSHSSVVLCSDDPDRLTMQKRLDDSEAEGHGGMSDLPGSVGSKSDDEKVLAGHRVELDTTPLIRQHSRLKKSVTICPRT